MCNSCLSLTFLFTACEIRSDIIFVLDISRSIGKAKGSFRIDDADRNFKKVTDFVSQVSELLQIGLEDNLVGVILFAKRADVWFDVREYTTKDELKTAINNIVYSEIEHDPKSSDLGSLIHRNTNTPKALNLLRDVNQLKLRRNAIKIAVVITDGKALFTRPKNTSHDFIETVKAAERLHSSGIYTQIYAIGIEGREGAIIESQLKAIATDESYAFTLSSFTSGQFNALRRSFTRTVCAREYFLYYNE